MTWQWTYTGTPNDAVNLAPSTGGVAMYNFKEFLKQLGWSVVSSSDGTTYNSSGDQITTGASGAGGMANNSAWFRVYFAGTGYEMVFQRSTTNLLWRAKWSQSGRFTGGTPNATTPPTAADQQFLQGTDVPAFVSLFANDNTYKQHMGGDTTDGSFWALFPTTGSPGTHKLIWLIPLLAGTYPSQDTAPYIVQCTPGNPLATAQMNSTTTTSNAAQGYYKKGLAGEAWVGYRLYALGAGAAGSLAGIIPVNAYTSGDNIWPGMIMRVSADGSGGVKGLLPTSHTYPDLQSRNAGDVVDVGSARYAIFANMALRWPAGVTPVL